MDYLPYLGFVLAAVCVVLFIANLDKFAALFDSYEPQNFNDYRRLAQSDRRPRKRFDGDPSRHRLVRKVEFKPFDDAA